MTKDEATNIVNQTIDSVTSMNPVDDEFTSTTKLDDHFDSIDVMEIIGAIEEIIVTSISDEQVVEFKTIGDLVAFVEKYDLGVIT